MNTELQQVNFSELLRDSGGTVQRLMTSPARALRLARRDAPDLVLTTAARADQDDRITHLATRVLAAVMANPVVRAEYLLDILPEVFPWVAFLPPHDVAQFAAELIRVMEASAELESPAAVLETIAMWQHTAQIYSDPELLAQLRSTEVKDLGSVPEPPAVPDES